MTQCPICLEPYDLTEKQPCILSCFHTFCGYCLRKMSSQSSISCPFCSRISEVPSTKMFPINYAVRDIVEECLVGQKDRICEAHEDKHPAVDWCIECEQVFSLFFFQSIIINCNNKKYAQTSKNNNKG
jgi:hypothetical protein